MYEPRFYRHWIKDSDLVSFEVVVKANRPVHPLPA
jgi:hypothetical protein